VIEWCLKTFEVFKTSKVYVSSSVFHYRLSEKSKLSDLTGFENLSGL
jgi:hypothetical protein